MPDWQARRELRETISWSLKTFVIAPSRKRFKGCDSLARTIIEIIRAGRPGDEHGQARIRGRTNQQLFLPDLLLIGADDDDDEQVPQLRVPDSKAHEQCLAPQYSGHDA